MALRGILQYPQVTQCSQQAAHTSDVNFSMVDGGENCSAVILAAALTNVGESSYLLKEG